MIPWETPGPLDQGATNFSLKDKMANILGFVGWSLGLCPIFFVICLFVSIFKNAKDLNSLSSGPQFAVACSGLAGWDVGFLCVSTSIQSLRFLSSEPWAC